MAKIIARALALILALSLLTACGNSNDTPGPAQWPDDEFTRLIPKPDFNLKSAGSGGNEFIACCKDVTLEQIKAYTRAVKAAGFTVNPALKEATTYEYTASNGAGYAVKLSRYADDGQTVYITITKE